MKEQELEVQLRNRLGLHARAAARFVHVATRYESRVTVTKDGCSVDGKSILGLLTLAAPQGCVLHLRASGEDAEQVLADLEALIRDRFGEER